MTSRDGKTRKKNIYCLMGPTAAGKTALAVQLVQRLPLDIISVDSTQVYRGMNIGSGKPDAEILDLAPHRLIDIRDPADSYSANQFRHDALTEIDQVFKGGKVPLLVGGTMLYFKVLRDGMAAMPAANPAIRQEIEELAQSAGWPAVHRQLAKVDPVSARRIHPNDPQRLQRALEVFQVSGIPMSEFHKRQNASTAIEEELPFRMHFLAIQPEQRQVLHERIATRYLQMLKDGLVPEVETLYQRRDLHGELPAIKSVGYRQVWQYLCGEINYDEMVEKGIIATRQLAKRQFTWLRSWPELHNLDSRQEKSLDYVLKIVESASI